ncbi:MAG TPA: thrombospondin type 3 repeat-containing protein [Fimbriimonadaceae bacterium]|nr:thrombospondin type 3 repeat-containing protein [Fimbriimonadaceae bacterium]
MKRMISTTTVLGLAVAAMAIGSMVKVVQETYKFKPDSAAASAKCMLCHTKKMGGTLNPYGLDLKAALKGSKNLTPAILHSIDNKDSDGDGVKNGAELTAGSNPGFK